MPGIISPVTLYLLTCWVTIRAAAFLHPLVIVWRHQPVRLAAEDCCQSNQCQWHQSGPNICYQTEYTCYCLHIINWGKFSTIYAGVDSVSVSDGNFNVILLYLMTSLCGSSMYINCLLFKQYTVLSLFIADLTDVLKFGKNLAQH